MSDFATVLKQLRNNLGYTQEQLAQKLGITKSRLGMYEIGKRKPDFETLELIADFFNVDMNYLLGKTNKTTRLEFDIIKQTILKNYNELNLEGQNKLKDYSEDLVASGKYTVGTSSKENVDDYITVAAARGNSELSVKLDKKAVLEDLEKPMSYND